MLVNDPGVANQIQKFLETFGAEADVRIYSSNRGYTLREVQISNGFLAGFRTVDKSEVYIPVDKIRKIFSIPKSQSELTQPKIHIYI